MTTVPLAEARAHLSHYVEEAVRTHQRIEITRNGSRAIVIVSAEDFDGLLETLDILSDAELIEVLKKNPDFQKDGKFDATTYHEAMTQWYRRTPEDYEAEVRRQLSAQKLLDLVEQGAEVSEDEVKARYQKEANKAKIGRAHV